MHGIYKLKDMLCKELEEYGERSQLDSNSLEVVDTLAHALKNIDKVIEYKEMESYSEAMSREGMSRDGMSRDGYSRGSIEDGMGHYYWPQYTRYSERSMNSRDGSYRYSRDGRMSRNGYSGNEMADQLREMMNEAPDESTRKELQRLISKMENM